MYRDMEIERERAEKRVKEMEICEQKVNKRSLKRDENDNHSEIPFTHIHICSHKIM